MKIAIAAAALLLAAVTPHGVQATRTKTPVNETCPLVINVPTSISFQQAKGGYIIVTVDNPSGASVSGVTVSYDLSATTTDSTNFPNGGLIALLPGTGSGVQKRGKSSMGAPAPTITSGGRVVTYTGISVGAKKKMKLGVGVDINCGTKRVSNVRPTFSYTGPTGALCTGQTSRTLGVGTRITPCGDPVMSAGDKGKSVQYNKYAAAYRNCQDPLTAITTGVSPQACADACTANHECRSFVINPAGTQCNLYKGNPGDGNTRSFLAYVEAQGFTLYVAVSGNKQGLPINGVASCTKPF